MSMVTTRNRRRSRRLRLLSVIMLLGPLLAGCVVAPAPYYAYRGGGWCYWHPYRC
jgi:hypothetical protein